MTDRRDHHEYRYKASWFRSKRVKNKQDTIQARYSYKIRMSGFTTFLGIISLLFGIAEWIGMTSLQGALLLIVLGALVIFKPWFDRRQFFGKAEQSRV